VLLGTDTSGHVFSEETRTVVLSRHGAGVLSRHWLAPDEILTLRFLGGTSEVDVRLVGEMGEDARGSICARSAAAGGDRCRSPHGEPAARRSR
jgi:hypothetical protein